jgi:hypothetical protein
VSRRAIVSPRAPAVGDLAFIAASLRAALAILDGSASPPVRVRFLEPCPPYVAGAEANLPARAAVEAIQRGDAELAVDPRERGRR